MSALIFPLNHYPIHINSYYIDIYLPLRKKSLSKRLSKLIFHEFDNILCTHNSKKFKPIHYSRIFNKKKESGVNIFTKMYHKKKRKKNICIPFFRSYLLVMIDFYVFKIELQAFFLGEKLFQIKFYHFKLYQDLS